MSMTTPAMPESRAATGRETRVYRLQDVAWRESGAGDGQLTMEGHASVFDRLSLPLFDWWFGEFQERIAPSAFANVLDRDPDVHLVQGHNMDLVLARTRSKTLDLREDDIGLKVWARVAPTSYALDLQMLMERGDVDQMSFAFTVERDTWVIENPDSDEERVIRTVDEIRDLYDVSVVPQGAYPQTDVGLRQREATGLIEAAFSSGRLPDEAEALFKRRAGTSPAGANPRVARLKARARVALATANTRS